MMIFEGRDPYVWETFLKEEIAYFETIALGKRGKDIILPKGWEPTFKAPAQQPSFAVAIV